MAYQSIFSTGEKSNPQPAGTGYRSIFSTPSQIAADEEKKKKYAAEQAKIPAPPTPQSFFEKAKATAQSLFKEPVKTIESASQSIQITAKNIFDSPQFKQTTNTLGNILKSQLPHDAGGNPIDANGQQLDPRVTPIQHLAQTIASAGIPLTPLSFTSKAPTVYEAIKGAIAGIAVGSPLQALAGEDLKSILKSIPSNALFGAAFAGKPIDAATTKIYNKLENKKVLEKPKDVSLTPEVLKNNVIGSDLNGTPLGEHLLKVADEAESTNKDIKIVPGGGKVLDGTTPQGNKLGYELVEPTKIELLKEEGGLPKEEPPKESAKTVQEKAQPISREARSKAQEDISNLISEAQTPEEITHATNALIEAHKDSPANLKMIRAQLAKDMNNKAGLPKNYYTPGLKHLEEFKKDPELGPQLNALQGGINKIDELVKEQTPVRVVEKAEPLIKENVVEKAPEAVKESIKEVAEKPPVLSDTKVSKLATDIQKELNTDWKDIPGYETKTPGWMKDQAEQGLALYQKDPQLAHEIAMGRKDPTGSLRAGTVFKVVKKVAIDKGDIDTLHELAKTDLRGEAGQSLKAFDDAVLNPHDPVKIIGDVIRDKSKAFEEKTGKSVKEARKEQLAKLKKEIEKVAPGKNEWSKFIESIKC